MEDVKRMSLALINKMDSDLKISMSIEDEDKFYDSLSLFLEESFNWPDYKNHN